MYDLITNLFSIAMYVLQAIGLYTIAKRRGIGRPWMAWVPVASLWLLGSIADSYKQTRTGRPRKFRVLLVCMTVAALVLEVAVMALSFQVLMDIHGSDSLEEVYDQYSQFLYEDMDEEKIEQWAEEMVYDMTDRQMERILNGSLALVGCALVLAGAAITATVFELICLHDLYASCDPNNKTLYLVLSIFLGLGGVFVFVCRNKDQGMYPPAPPAGYMPPQQTWQQQYDQHYYQPPQYQPPQQNAQQTWQQQYDQHLYQPPQDPEQEEKE